MGCELNSGSIGRIRGLHHIAVLVALPALWTIHTRWSIAPDANQQQGER